MLDRIDRGHTRVVFVTAYSGHAVRAFDASVTRIVRIDAVRDVETLESGQYLLRLQNGMRVATGRSYRARLREVLGLA